MILRRRLAWQVLMMDAGFDNTRGHLAFIALPGGAHRIGARYDATAQAKAE